VLSEVVVLTLSFYDQPDRTLQIVQHLRPRCQPGFQLLLLASSEVDALALIIRSYQSSYQAVIMLIPVLYAGVSNGLMRLGDSPVGKANFSTASMKTTPRNAEGSVNF